MRLRAYLCISFAFILFALALCQFQRSPEIGAGRRAGLRAWAGAAPTAGGENASAENSRTARAKYMRMPLSFEPNVGQSAAEVKFLSHGSGYGLFLTSTEVVLATGGDKHAAVRMKLEGANPSPQVSGVEPLRGRTNYFIGNDPSKWRTDVPTYGKVKYAGVYPGVDLLYYGNQQQLEYDFVLKPGADPRAIRLKLDGAQRIEVNAQGDLVIRAGGSEVIFRKPVVYQPEGRGASKAFLDGRFVLKSKNEVAFEVANFDSRRALVIDPSIALSTLLGGAGADGAIGLALDNAGAIYVTGGTTSANFPTAPVPNPIQPLGYGGGPAVCGDPLTFACGDAFVGKLDPTMSGAAQLVYATYIGGSDREHGSGIAVDSSGNAYISGATHSGNFPTTAANALKAGFPAGSSKQGFLTKLNATGNGLLYSTFIGGSGSDEAELVALDFLNRAYVSGFTGSADFPTTTGAFQTACNSCASPVPQPDAFVIAIDTTKAGAASLFYGTYLGGSGADQTLGIAVDTFGKVYVTGNTTSMDFPVSAAAAQGSFGGGGTSCPAQHGFVCGDAFVTKLDPTKSGLAQLVYSTYLGGSGEEIGVGVAVDTNGNAYVAGGTDTNNASAAVRFPISTGAKQSTFGGGAVGCLNTGSACGDGFVTEVNATGTAFVFSTYIGGSGDDLATGIALDSVGNIYVSGVTNSNNFPVTPNALQGTFGGGTTSCVTPGTFCGDAFLAVLSPGATNSLFTTYSGASGDDAGFGVALDSASNIFAAGVTGAPGIPTTGNAFQTGFGGGASDAFVAEFSIFNTNPSAPCSNNWTGPLAGGDWNTAADWSTLGPFPIHAVPTALDNVCINNGATVTISAPLPSANQVVSSIQSSNGTLIISGGTLTVTNPTFGVNSIQSSVNNLTISGGTLIINTRRNFNINGTLTLSSGTINSHFSGPTASGPMIWSGGTILGATFQGSPSPFFANSNTTISGPVILDNASFLDSGTLLMSGPGTTLTAMNGSQVSTGTAAASWDMGDSQGILQGAGAAESYIVNGTLTKTGGGVSTVALNVLNNNLVRVNNAAGTLAMTGGGSSSGGKYTVTAGTMEFDGSTTIPGVLVSGAGKIVVGAGNTLFSGGTFNVSGGITVNGNVAFSEGVLNTGPLTVNSGAANFGFGGAIAAGGIGPVTVAGGTLTFSTGQAGGVGLSTVALNGGILTGGDDLNVAGAFNWTGGMISGTGALNLNGGWPINFGAAGILHVDTRVINNAGLATWSGTGSGQTFQLDNGAVIKNLSTGVFDIQGENNIPIGSGTLGTFNNMGTLKKSAGTGAGALINVTMNNTGTVQAQSGNLQFSSANGSGSFSVTSGATLTFNSGTDNLSGPFSGAGVVVVTSAVVNFLAGASASGLNSLTVGAAGTVNIATGVNLGFATVNLNSGGILSGTGSVTGNINNTSGSVHPGMSPGILTVNGSYSQGPGGTLNIDLGGTTAGSGYSQLVVNGLATLGGTLNVTDFGGFTPAAGNTFAIVLPGTLAAGTTFATTNLPSPPTLSISYAAAPTGVVISAPSGLPTFSSATLPNGAVGVPYGADIQVTGGQQPYTFAVTSGTLPAGFSLNATASGNVSAGHVFGSPATAATFTFGITVTDALNQMTTATVSLTIGAAPANTQASLLKGRYALLFHGFGDSNGVEEGDTGSLNFDGVGNVTGIIDLNSTSGIMQAVAVTGAYSVGPDNRGFLVLTASGMPGSFSVAMAVGNVYRGVASTVRLTEFNNNNANHRIGSGFLRLQDPTAFSQNSFAGTYVFGDTGQSPSLQRVALAGLVSFDNALNVTSGIADQNQAGTLFSITSITGTYTAPDANGRIVLSLTFTPGGTSTQALYLISTNEAIVMNLDARASNILVVGSLLRQSNPGTFTNGSIAGPDVLRLAGRSSGSTDTSAIIGLATTTAGTTLTINFDQNKAGTVLTNQSISGSYNVATNGRASASLVGTNGPATLILYLAQPDRGFAINVGGSAEAGQLEPQSGPPFAASPFNSNFFFGLQETLTPKEAVSGIAALGAPGTFNLTADDSHSGGNLKFGENATLNFTVAPNGHFTGMPGTSIGGATGYVVSPFEMAFLDTGGSASNPSPSAHPDIFLAQSIPAAPGTASPVTAAVNFPTPLSAGMTAQAAPILVTNTGMGPLAFTGVNTANSPDFKASGTCLPVSGLLVIQPQGTCTIIITFAPTASTATGTLLSETLVALNDGTTSVTITATGTAAPTSSCTKTFNVASGTWETAANWTPAGLPAGTDTVCIPAGDTATLSTTPSIAGLTLQGTVSGTGGLNVSGAASLSGTLGSGTHTFGGLVTWSGGTMGPNAVTNANGGMAITGAVLLLSSTLNSNGNAVISGPGQLTMDTSAFNQGAGFTFDIQNDMPIMAPVNKFGTFNNAGTLKKSAGTGTTDFNGVKLNNTGTLTLLSGTISLTNVSNNSSSGSVFLFAGTTLRVSPGAALNLSGPIAGPLSSPAGTLQVASTATVNFNAGSSATTLSALNIAGGSVTLNGAGTIGAVTINVSNGGQLANPGTLSGNVVVTGGSALSIFGPGNFPGTMTINGSFSIDNVSTIFGLLANTTPNTGFSQLVVNGAATVGGALNYTSIGFTPVLGNSLTLVNATTLTGTFASNNFPTLPNTVWNFTYNTPTGTAVATLAGATGPAVTLAPAGAVSFGNVPVGNTNTRTVMLTNTGGAPLLFASSSPFGISGANVGDFSQINNCPVAPATLAANAFCTITLKFSPAPSAISETATLNISDNAVPFNTPNGSIQTVALSGTGVGPVLTFSPPTGLSFGNQTQGLPSSPMTLRVDVNSNFGTWLVNGISIMATGTGTGANDFAQTNNCGTSVGPENSCTIMVTFTPSITGPESANLVLAGNQAGSPLLIPLTGTGTAPSTSFTFAPALGTGTQATIIPGNTAQFTIMLNSSPNSSGPVSFSCLETPATTTIICSVSPSSATLNGSTPITLVVTMLTNCVAALPPRGPVGMPPTVPPQVFVLWMLSLLGLAAVRRFAPETRLARVAPAVVMLMLTMTWAGCGAASVRNVKGAPTTPPGLYTLTIKATSGAAVQTIQLLVRVT